MAAPTLRRGLTLRAEGGAVALLLVTFACQSLSAVWHKSNTFDETAHLAAGYSYWRFNDYHLQPENGNLPQRLAGLLLLSQHVTWPSPGQPDRPPASAFLVGQQMLFELDNDPELLLHRGRLGVLLAGLGLGLTVFFWSRRLHGAAGGLLSLAMFAFCPTMLAHGALITSDMTNALFYLLASWTLWELLTLVTIGRLLAAGAALGGLCLSKHSAPLFAPMATVLLTARCLSPTALAFAWRGQPLATESRLGRGVRLGASLAAILLCAWAIVWAAYGFRFAAAGGAPSGVGTPFVRGWDEFTLSSSLAEQTLDAALGWHLLPEAFLYGLKYTLAHTEVRLGFLAGTLSMTGWWWFFPYAALVKTPLSVFAICAAALWATLRAPRGARSVCPARLSATLPIWTLLVVYWAAAMSANLNIGHRHVLLTYPALYVLCGALGPAVLAGGRVFRALVLLLFLGLVGESFATRPHYLAFFNAAAGGPARGYRHLVDSSLDWGQDLPTLEAWLAEHAAGQPVYLSYFGTSSPRHYGIQATSQPHFGVGVRFDDAEYFRPLTPGIYCISATHYQNVQLPLPNPWDVLSESRYQALRPLYRAVLASGADPGDFGRIDPAGRDAYRSFASLRWARLCAYLRSRDRKPDASAGYSILIFKLNELELHEALEGPMPRDPLRVKP